MFVERKDGIDTKLTHRLEAGTIDQAQLLAICGKQRRLPHDACQMG
jgi:hypothetical protein